MEHLTRAQLEAGLDGIRQSPEDAGRLELIVRRPSSGDREIVTEGELDVRIGLVGDNWSTRGNPRRPEGHEILSPRWRAGRGVAAR